MFTTRWLNEQILVLLLFSNKKESLLVCATLWVNFKIIMLSFKKCSPPKKRKGYIYILYDITQNSRKCKLIYDERNHTVWKIRGSSTVNSENGGSPNGTWELLGVVNLFIILKMMMVSWMYMCLIKLQTLYVCHLLCINYTSIKFL